MIPSRVHLIGVGGVGMAAVAHYLIGTVCSVSGSDTARSAASDHEAANIDGSRLVVLSDAIATDNVEIEAARSRHIPLLRRAESLDALARTG